jgi:glycosyltransferase involved in cell wall biosynthesis
VLRTLSVLDRQRQPPGGAEVIVADDGSRDGTPAALVEAARNLSLPVTPLATAGSGPASARNRGAEAAQGEVLLFLGDDTEPAADSLLVRHSELHAASAGASQGVLGRVTWDPRVEITPLMRWLDRSGQQFDYGGLQPGPVSPSSYLYSSHVSLERTVFEGVGGFDERFPHAAVEDTELGTRLERAGVELEYHPELVVHHDHPTELAGSLERTARVGRSAALFHRLHPDLAHARVRRPQGARWQVYEASAPVLSRLPADRLPRPAADLCWTVMHRAAYARGYRLGPP